jgi:DNA topoisomerase IA
LEEDLDKISSGNSNYFDFIKSFWSKFYTLFKPFYN